jgi:ABC-2 type transport system permease protein
MMKLLKIAWKDFRITYRDLTELLLMIAAPLAMTLVMSFAFSGTSSTGFSSIPVALINLDDGMTGEMIKNALFSNDVQEYIAVEEFTSLEEARKELDNDKLGAVIMIPSNASTLFNATQDEDIANIEEFAVDIQLYTNPVRPNSGMIVESILDSILTQFNAGFTGGLIGFSELLNQGLVTIDELSNGLGEEIGQKIEPLFNENQAAILIETQYWQEEKDEFNWLSYMAPSMAILYLGFSMTTSARSILNERENGTFNRLLASPTSAVVIIAGKMVGTFLIGLIQVFVFIIASIPLLGIKWGNPGTLILFTCVLVMASASWGIVIASLAKNGGQASALGTAVNLIFAAIAGNFVPRGSYPEWLQQIGYLTPNAWGIEGYLKLINGGVFSDVRSGIFVLLGMSFVLLLIATISFALQYGQIKKTRGKHA